jgi:hypothetical protein
MAKPQPRTILIAPKSAADAVYRGSSGGAADIALDNRTPQTRWHIPNPRIAWD